LAIKKIVVKFLDELKSSLNDKNIRLNISEGAVDLLAEQGYDSKMGARPLSRKIDELVRVPLSKKILFDRLQDVAVTINVDNNTLVFDIENSLQMQPTVDDNGYIIIDQINH
jgi:ATP-dependent Clp protease ATP-binding subunit ClpA